jgi:hypothetical protein
MAEHRKACCGPFRVLTDGFELLPRKSAGKLVPARHALAKIDVIEPAATNSSHH